jgi:hypothetical protein
MILSQKRVNELLKIFDNPKSIIPYDNSKEKEEMKNASAFIANYHIYGRPPKYNTKTYQTFYNNNVSQTISRNQTINSKGSSLLRKLTNGNKKLKNYNDIQIQKSLTNLKIGQQEYMKEQQVKLSKNNDYYKNYNAYSTISYSSEFEKNQRIYNSILNSSNLATTNYLYEPNNYNEKKYNSKLLKSSRLGDIPANPDDVVIRELPSNFVLSVNPISSSNIGMGMNMNNNMGSMVMNQNNMEVMPETINEPPKVIEEINTDIIQNEENQQNEQIEEPPKEESLKKEEEQQQEEVTPIQSAGKYQITALNGPVTVPPGYSTNDEDEYNAIQILNEDLSSWKKQIDKPNIKVYTKLYKVKNDEGGENDNVMLYTDATIDYPASEVIRHLNTYDLRKKWEKSLEKGKLLKQEDLGNNVSVTEYYSYIKMPFIFSDRDLVVRKTVWNDYQGEKDCCLCQLHSIEHPEYPPKEKPVRATFENRGEYVKPIDANKCKLYFVSKFDMKLSAPISMMEGKGSEGQEKWVKEFIKQIGK